MTVLRPADPREAVEAFAANPRALALAGGTDLMVAWNMAQLEGRTILDLSRVKDWTRIRVLRDGIRIGALATHAQIRRHPEVRRRFPLLAEACATVGAQQIQNRGTIGGNIANASPAGDTFPALAVYEARVHLVSVEGWRIVPFPEVFAGVKKTTLRPGELIEAVEIPFPHRAPDRRMFRKVGSRLAQTISKTAAAGLLFLKKDGTVERLRFALGSVAPTVKRLWSVESVVLGRRLTPELVEKACSLLGDDISPIDDIRSTRRYRLRVSENLLRAFLGCLLLCAMGASPYKALLLVTDKEALREIEQSGGSLGELLEGRESRGFNNELLSKRRRFGGLVSVLSRDLEQLSAEDSRLGPGVSHAHRLFDAGWLRSPEAVFELIGVVNRLDRQPFDDGSCGEIRLVYRLGYDTSRERDLARSEAPPAADHTAAPGAYAASRLPMTLSLTYAAQGEKGELDCRAVARRWLVPSYLNGRALGAWMASAAGPLAPPLLYWRRLKSVDVNLQSARWPASARPNMGGHAEHLLRSFQFDSTAKNLIPKALENTPDVRRLKSDRRLRASLLAWLKDPANLARIEAGTASLPRTYLALRALSAAPHGLLRKANRPFAQLFLPQDFVGLPFGKNRLVRSPLALVRRLDDMSCAGCHQARALAGFHLLGDEPPGAPPGNSLEVAVSPHLARDLSRRRDYVLALAVGKKPSPERTFSERAAAGDDGYGAHCGLGDPGFASWTCAKGLSCAPRLAGKDAPEIGQCLPPGKPLIGDPCEAGTLAPAPDPHEDRVDGLTRKSCGENRACDPSSAGFPGGMCSSTCALLNSEKNGVCGGLCVLEDFGECLARKEPFSTCVADRVRPAGLRACDWGSPCRDDYVCARAQPGRGACVPPSFLLQLRADGHPPSSQ